MFLPITIIKDFKEISFKILKRAYRFISSIIYITIIYNIII